MAAYIGGYPTSVLESPWRPTFDSPPVGSFDRLRTRLDESAYLRSQSPGVRSVSPRGDRLLQAVNGDYAVNAQMYGELVLRNKHLEARVRELESRKTIFSLGQTIASSQRGIISRVHSP